MSAWRRLLPRIGLFEAISGSPWSRDRDFEGLCLAVEWGCWHAEITLARAKR